MKEVGIPLRMPHVGTQIKCSHFPRLGQSKHLGCRDSNLAPGSTPSSHVDLNSSFEPLGDSLSTSYPQIPLFLGSSLDYRIRHEPLCTIRIFRAGNFEECISYLYNICHKLFLSGVNSICHCKCRNQTMFQRKLLPDLAYCLIKKKLR